jgi:type I restriction enzyme S subunit
VILEKFDNFINPTFEKVLSNLIQIQTLTKTRDELLPRLMSGEVRVKQ